MTVSRNRARLSGECTEGGDDADFRTQVGDRLEAPGERAGASLAMRNTAFSRLLGLAIWAQSQSEHFSVQDVRESFPRAYCGSLQATERMWTRDKGTLARVGLPFVFDGVAYTVPSRLSIASRMWSADTLERTVRETPIAALELEIALRKLWALGAPIGDALRSRHSQYAHRNDSAASASLEQQLAMAYCLLVGLQRRTQLVCSLEEAKFLAAARSDDELARIVEAIQGIVLPLPPPDDELALEVESDSLYVIYRCHPVHPLALTDTEIELVTSELDFAPEWLRSLLPRGWAGTKSTYQAEPEMARHSEAGRVVLASPCPGAIVTS